MKAFRIGSVVNSLNSSVRKGMRKARELGIEGVQILPVLQDFDLDMSAAARANFRGFCAKLGMEIVALFAVLGRDGLESADSDPGTIVQLKKTIDLAADVGAKGVAAHIGIIPEDCASRVYGVMVSAAREAAQYARAKGMKFAIETGPEPALRLKEFLNEVDDPAAAVNLDPANLLMVMADDPVAAVYTLKGYVFQTHAKDGVQLRPCKAEEVYKSWMFTQEQQKKKGPIYEVKPLGEGGVNWTAYLSALGDIGFSGYLSIESEGGDPVAYMRDGVRFLKARMTELGMT